MTDTAEASKHWFFHLAPLWGVGAGTAIAWALSVCLGLLSNPTPLDIALRFLAVVTPVVWWAVITTAMQGRAIYAGGTEPESDGLRAGAIRSFAMVFWVLAIISVCTDHLLPYWGFAFLALLIVLGEMGWKKPLGLNI